MQPSLLFAGMLFMHVRILDHEIEKASGLILRMGRFKGSVAIDIGGTIGCMTVDATELRNALDAVIHSWASEKVSHEVQDAVVKRQTIGPMRGEKTAKRLDSTNMAAEGQPKDRGSLNSPSRPSGTTVNDAIEVLPEIALPPAVSKADKSKTGGQLYGRRAHQDTVIRILSPETAAKKLGLSLEEILDRRRQLGLKHP